MIRLPEYYPSDVNYNLKHLYMLCILMENHKNGKCQYSDVYETALRIDSNTYRANKVAEEFSQDKQCVRGIAKNGEMYLASIRKPFNHHVKEYDDWQVENFITFRDQLLLRTITKVKRISTSTIAKRFNLTQRQIFNIIKKLRESGQLEIVNNFIVLSIDRNTEIETTHVPDSDKRAIKASNSYYLPDNRNDSGHPISMHAEYVKEIKNSCGKRGRYFEGDALWVLSRKSGPVDNFEMLAMSRSAKGAKTLYKIMDRLEGKG